MPPSNSMFFCLIILFFRDNNSHKNVHDDDSFKDDGNLDYRKPAELVYSCGEDASLGEDRMKPKYGKDYVAGKRPVETKGVPLLVEVNMLINDIIKVDTKSQSIAMEAVTVLDWKDTGISISEWCDEDVHGKYIVLPGGYAEENDIWVPDIFIDKASKIRNPIYLNDASSIRFHENHVVSFSTLLNWNTACNMDFTFFPFDKQVCAVSLESFGWPTKHLNISWSEHRISNNSELLQINGWLDMYELEMVYDKTEFNYGGTDFGTLHMELHLSRKFLYYFLHVYMPSTFLMTVSYCSLYLAPTSKVPRIGMSLVTLISITTTINDVKSTMPRVTYITMADAWLFPIVYYSFLNLFEFLFIQYLVELEREVLAKKIEYGARVLFAIIPLAWSSVYIFVAQYFGYKDMTEEG